MTLYFKRQLDIQNKIINKLAENVGTQKPPKDKIFYTISESIKHNKRRLFRVLAACNIIRLDGAMAPLSIGRVDTGCIKGYLNNTIIYENTNIAFFVHYDPLNVISDEDFEYIGRLKEVAAGVVFITNSVLPNRYIDKMEERCLLVISRPNYGFDFGAWKDGLSIFGFEELKKYGGLILANNSCYPPLFSLKHVFAEMDKRGAGFWGMTVYPDNIKYKRHVQSYFMVFNKSLIGNECFKTFWGNVDYELNIKNVILKYESELTAYLQSAGFGYSVFNNDTELFVKKDVDLLRENPLFLVERGFPFIKKKSIITLDQYHGLVKKISRHDS
jgi:lipopolysaccharide biosynthesis protein